MGLGDQLIATGLARDAQKRKKRIAFGNGREIIWDQHSAEIFKNNPNIAAPGSEFQSDLEWINFYKGYRGYNHAAGDHWSWNMNWRCKPGQIFFSHQEKLITQNSASRNFILIEPHVVGWKNSSSNKDWGFKNYQELANCLAADKTHEIVQLVYPGMKDKLSGIHYLATTTFRQALAIMKSAKLYLGPEGGMHHGAAAVSIPGVVIFGGFIPPQVTGYDTHINLVGSDRFCGSFSRCQHCADAMKKISVEMVYESARRQLRG